MAPNGISSRRPFAGKGKSLSATLGVATQSCDQLQTTRSTTHPESGSQPTDSHLAPQHPGSAASATRAMMIDEHVQHENDGMKANGKVVGAASADYEIEKLESEVIHFMKLSMEERQKSQTLSKNLVASMQEREDLAQQLQQLQEELDETKIGAQENETMSARLQETVAILNDSIDELRNMGHKHDADIEEYTKRCTNTIGDLEAQLDAVKTQLAQKTQSEADLRQKLDGVEKDLKSQRSSNATLGQSLRQVQKQRDKMLDSNTSTTTKLTETVQTANTLSDVVKRKIAELEDVKKAAKEETESLQRDITAKKAELKGLTTSNEILMKENEELKSVLEESHRDALIARQTEGAKVVRLEEENKAIQQELEILRREKMAVDDELARKVQQIGKRWVRTVAICVDLSGSVSSSDLTGGVKRFYAHLLNYLKQATCKTYVMTVVHGPDARVKSDFGSSWADHENALKYEQNSGSEAYVACLRKIKEATISTGLIFADLQIILIGDGDAYNDNRADVHSLCQEFTSSDPPVPIHSVVVQQVAGACNTIRYTQDGWSFRQGLWHTWEYASSTKGNNIYWGQADPLPDLDGLLL